MRSRRRGCKRIVGRQRRLGIAAGELDRAGVAGGDVAIGIVGGNGEITRRARGGGVGKPVTVSEEAAAATTVIFDSVPVVDGFAVSVAVIDCMPAVSTPR